MLLGAISKRYDTIVEFTAFEDFISFDKEETLNDLQDKYDTVKSQNSKLQNELSSYKTASNSSSSAYQKSSSNTTESNVDSSSYEVYITNTGSKYHRDGCSYLRQSQIGISKSDAIAQGYTPCSRCNP